MGQHNSLESLGAPDTRGIIFHGPPGSAREKDWGRHVRQERRPTTTPVLSHMKQSLALLWDQQETPILRVYAKIHHLWGKTSAARRG